MARLDQRYPDNAPGDVYVDRTCIDCGTCRHVAPGVFAEADDHSYVAHQPDDPSEAFRSRLAMVACPTGSIGTVSRTPLRDAVAAFPIEVLPDVYYCGFASPDSYGASAWLVRRPDGNVLVDSPRAAAPLLTRIEALGGVRWMFLTHKDDVADHATFAERFGAQRLLHVADRTPATAGIERPVTGDVPVRFAPDLTILPLPGHTRGSMGLLLRDDVLFSGDHLWARDGALAAGRSVCWYDWRAQIASMERLRDVPFGHVLPGHGAPWHGGHAAKGPALEALVEWMRRVV
jgi:glyoxylase-like metal-dependent hydrolase (beta-lactamase superfamily II)